IAAAVGAAALCASLAACANSSGGGGNIASVNGQAITRADFDKKLESSPAARQALNQMVQQDLIDQYARDKKVDVSEAEIDKKEAETKARFPAGQFEQILKQQGLTESDVQNILKQQLVLEKAVAPQVKVSDADVKAYFDKNHALFDKPEQVKARHILVADAKTAQTVLAKLKADPSDASWLALAKQYSTDPSTKDKGGDLGYFGRGQMVPAFQDAAFGAKVGQIVGPVKSPFGYHVIQVEDKKPATKATFANTKDQIKQQLTQQQEAQQVPLFLQQLRSNAKIDVSDDRYKDAFPPPVTPAPVTSTAPAPAPTK
ncbi:MAG: peptidylprolyl isomerase, partial [Candidatus Eremiobacteraeota bacterium]|nr:peptidylprolyl isomerase [Candidatus Eremiobacteraeota bacterium]